MSRFRGTAGLRGDDVRWWVESLGPFKENVRGLPTLGSLKTDFQTTYMTLSYLDDLLGRQLPNCVSQMMRHELEPDTGWGARPGW